MIKVYYSSRINNIYWKIFADYLNKQIYYFPYGSNIFDVANKTTQISLLDAFDNQEKIYVVDISEWETKDKQSISLISELASLKQTIIFAYESKSFTNKLFNELKIEIIKTNNVNKKSKQQMVHFLLGKANIKLNHDVEQYLIDLLPDKIDFINNEINKISLLYKETYSKDDIKQIVFDSGEITIFNAIDAWLKNDINNAIKIINNYLLDNDILEFIPIYANKLAQLKFLFMAKKQGWSPSAIESDLGIPQWVQMSYSYIKSYEKAILKIDNIITKLYNFDINIKKQKVVPYSQLIKILIEQ